MTTQSNDRPVARRRPQPAADEGTDPVVGRNDQAVSASSTPPVPVTASAPDPAAASTEPPAEEVGPVAPPAAKRAPAKKKSQAAEPAEEAPAPAVRRGPVPTVQLNTRVALEVSDLLERLAGQTGHSKRHLIEEAIRQTYA